MPGPRVAARVLPGPVHAHRHLGVAVPPGHRPVLDVQGLDPGDVDPDGDEDLLEGHPGRHGIREVDDRQHVDQCREFGIDHGWRSPVAGIYLGCMRMPASMRIDSAFMYELDSSSTASVANSVARPSRCGKSTSWANLSLNASEPSPAP